MTGSGASNPPQTPPWWASVADDVDPDEDPLAAHRAARAGRTDGNDATDRSGDARDDRAEEQPTDDRHAGHAGAPWGDLAEVVLRLAREATRSLSERERGRATANAAHRDRDDRFDAFEDGDAPPSHGDTCQYCPLCAGMRALEDVRPELVTHLSEAARHVTLAARAFVDAQADRYASADGFERIDLDDEV